ncbi:MAG TPA: DUF4376 domain-containing protein [Azonexus sp.]|nr:DUF4376 domain-containing protein [Azonexus sp.]
MFQLNGKKISIDRDLTIEKEITVGEGDDQTSYTDQVTYPAASLQNAELRAELGIVEVLDPVRPDDRLFFVTENFDGSFSAEPRPREQVTAPVWELIKSKREGVKAGGFKVDGKWFHSDADSRTQHLGLKDEARDVLAAGGTVATQLVIDGAPVVWKTMDGSFVPITVQVALSIVAAAKVLDKRAFAAAETHRRAMEAAANPFEYDYSKDWPKTYADTLAAQG